MHDEILSSKQKPLLSLVKTFSSKFSLIGGTAVALQLGHRRSIDFMPGHSIPNNIIKESLKQVSLQK